MPLHIGKYLADTAHLTRDQHGAYVLLLMAYWCRGGPLPADDARLAATAKATPSEWRRHLRPVLSEFFTEVDGTWRQKRCEIELDRARALSKAKAEAGKKGAESRWQIDSTAMAEPSSSHKQTDAPLPQPSTPTNQGIKNGFSGGGNGTVTIENSHERIARFQQKLAQALGPAGWETVVAACTRADPRHDASLALCKETARSLKKGWPRQWPIN